MSLYKVVHKEDVLDKLAKAFALRNPERDDEGFWKSFLRTYYSDNQLIREYRAMMDISPRMQLILAEEGKSLSTLRTHFRRTPICPVARPV